MKKILCYITISILLISSISCVQRMADQLAGRHWIKHPETGKQIWVPYGVTWDSKYRVWRYVDGDICGDGYLYDNDN